METSSVSMSTDGSRRTQARFLGLSPVGIGVKAIVTDHDLPLVGNVRGHPGDELQIIHRLLLRAVTAPAITDLAPGFQKRQPLQGEHRPEHVLADPLGLRLRLGPDEAAKGEPSARLSPASLSTGEYGGK